MSNNIRNILSCQQLSGKNVYSPRLYKAKDFKHYQKRISFAEWEKRDQLPIARSNSELIEHVAHLTPSTQKVLGYIIYMRSRGLVNFTSQEYIARFFSISRKTVSRSIQTLWSLHLIDVYNRGRNISNITRPADVLLRKDICEQIMQYLPICRSIFLMFLLVAPIVTYPESYYWASNTANAKHVSVLKYIRFNFNNVIGIDSDSSRRKERESIQKKEQFKLNHKLNTLKRDEGMSSSSNIMYKNNRAIYTNLPVTHGTIEADTNYDNIQQRIEYLSKDSFTDEQKEQLKKNLAKLGIF